MQTYYEILGVSPSTTQGEIKEAYRILAEVWHPDRFGSSGKKWEKANEKMKEINAAFDILKDPQKRGEYDTRLRREQPSSRPQEPPKPRFTPEQEQMIECNRQRYRRALCSIPFCQFSKTHNLEEARQKALIELDTYRIETAKELLAKYNNAAR